MTIAFAEQKLVAVAFSSCQRKSGLLHQCHTDNPEVETVKQFHPNAHYQGLADGAPENWAFLNTVTDTQTLDFYHATQYLDKAANAIYPRDEQAQKAWMDTHCHSLKHEVGAASRLLAEMRTIQPKRVSQSILQRLQDPITYFRNHHHQMLYVEAISSNLPIGSGITAMVSLSNSYIKFWSHPCHAIAMHSQSKNVFAWSLK